MGSTNSKVLETMPETTPPRKEKRSLDPIRHNASTKQPSPWRHLLDRNTPRKRRRATKQSCHKPKATTTTMTTTTMDAPTAAAMVLIINVMLGGGSNEERAAFGTRQARDPDRPSALHWTERPGWDTSTMVCERRFSHYPDLVVRGTNQVYNELKRRIQQQQQQQQQRQ